MHDEPLTIFLLNVEPTADRPVFYAEPSDDEENEGEAWGASRGGFRAGVEARLRRWKAALRHGEGRTARWSRKAWDWMHRRTHADEPLLSRLRKAPAVEL